MSLPVPDGVRRVWPRVRLLGGTLVLAVLAWRFGAGPFADAWRVATWSAVVAALAVNTASTLASAWRWRVVARAMGVPLTVRGSVTAYYRSQFLNTALPGGVLGDAHRGVRHGRGVGDLGAGVRATVWDRVAGQVVQLGLLVSALALLRTPLERFAPLTLLVFLTVAVVARAMTRLRRAPVAWIGSDLRILHRGPVAARVALTSCIATAGHVVVFLVAAHAVGVAASLSLLLTLALVVLVGSAVPLNVAGWGPREGVTTWVFGYVGLGAATGLTVSILYGVLAALATAPGAVVLLWDTLSARRARSGEDEVSTERPLEGASHG
jgi:glycosyltransferase 2 family protein